MSDIFVIIGMCVCCFSLGCVITSYVWEERYSDMLFKFLSRGEICKLKE